MSFVLAPATREDDPEIRALLRETPLPGSISLSYEREPDFFAGCLTLNAARHHAVVAREAESGALAGVVCREVRRVWLDGEPAPAGYLGGLRVAKRFRGRWLIPRGLRYLRELGERDPLPVVLAAITDENRPALNLFAGERRRHGAPVFREVSRLYTAAIPVRARPSFRPEHSTAVRRCGPGDLPNVLRFLNERGRERQLFPVLSGKSIGGENHAPRPEDFLIAVRSGEPRGVVAVWDQSSFRQVVVRGYSGALRRLRPAANALARAAGYAPLPPAGIPLKPAFAALFCVEQGDTETFKALLNGALALAAERRHTLLVAALTSDDPLLPVLRRRPHVAYRSRLYAVSWPGVTHEEGELYERLHSSPVHAEVSLL